MIRKHFSFILERTLIAPLLRILFFTGMLLVGMVIWIVWEDDLFQGLTTRHLFEEYAATWHGSEYFPQ